MTLSLPSWSHDLEAAIASDARSPKNVERDKYRNPYETLNFFQIKPNMKVVELSPGGGCLLYTSPSPRDLSTSRMPSSA